MRDAAAVRAPGSNPTLAGLPQHPLLTPSASRSSAFDGSAPSLVCGEVNLQVSSDDARLGLRRTIHLRLHMHRQSPTALTTPPPQPFAPSSALVRSQSASRPSPGPGPRPGPSPQPSPESRCRSLRTTRTRSRNSSSTRTAPSRAHAGEKGGALRGPGPTGKPGRLVACGSRGARLRWEPGRKGAWPP